MLSVVIPSYNRKDCVLALLRDVYRQEAVEFEVVVVDDCSPDGSYEAVAVEFPQVVLLRNETNGGPCVTRNKGILAAKGEFIVGLDSDVTVPDVRLLEKVGQAFAASPDATGFAFRLFAPDGVTDDTPRWWHPLPIESARDCRFETDYFSGTAYAFRREAVIAAGLFPEIYYMHYEEVELAWRVIDQGGSIFHSPDLMVVHHANPVAKRSEIKVFYKPRNQVLLALRCYPALSGAFYLLPRLANGVLHGVSNHALADWWRAMRSAIELAPACLGVRKPLSGSTWKRINALKRQPVGYSSSSDSVGLPAKAHCSLVK
jgi:GT2 family glycosyltransferase